MTRADEFIKRIHEESNLRRKSLTEDGSPQVGVFYYIDGKIYARMRSARDPSQVRRTGVIGYSTHFSFWFETLRHDHPEWAELPDWHFPRGRVVYDAEDDAYLVSMDRCIPEDKIPEILSEFNLRRLKNVKVQQGKDPETGTDHYKCACCDPENAPKVL